MNVKVSIDPSCIKKLSEENPNDMDLGKLIRAYVRQQEEMDSDEDTYNEELK